MTEDERSWAREGLPAEAREALASGPAGFQAVVCAARPYWKRGRPRRTAASLNEQWRKDRFVQHCYVDQRSLHEVEGHRWRQRRLFEAVELSPLAPLGWCSSVALDSQNKIVSTARGTEVVSDPTNVLALECARRLQEDSGLHVRLASTTAASERRPFRSSPDLRPTSVCLSRLAGHERENRQFLSDALAEHINTHLAALERLGGTGI